MSENECPTEIYFMTGPGTRRRLYSSAGAVKLALRGLSWSTNLSEVEICALEDGWKIVTSRFIKDGEFQW